jgi:hypothetical protein
MEPVGEAHRIQKAHIHHGFFLPAFGGLVPIGTGISEAADAARHSRRHASGEYRLRDAVLGDSHFGIPQLMGIVSSHGVQELDILLHSHLPFRDLVRVGNAPPAGGIGRIVGISDVDPLDFSPHGRGRESDCGAKEKSGLHHGVRTNKVREICRRGGPRWRRSPHSRGLLWPRVRRMSST